MTIQTIGGASTTIQGTPILKLSLPGIAGSGIDYSQDATQASYNPTTPLPPGTYAITITANNPCQLVFLKSNNTVVNAGKVQGTGTATVTTTVTIAAGETVTKIVFRKPSRNSWPTTFNVDITAITDPKQFFGHTVKQYNTAAPLPTNWSFNRITYGQPMQPGTMRVTSTTTKSYFIAFNNTFVETPVASGTLTSNLQDGIRLYELDISTMALTQKATPQLGGTIQVQAGYTFPGGSTSQGLEHFALGMTYFLVGQNVAYFVPGPSRATYVSGGTTYYAMRNFQKMSVYTFATNTWADHDGPLYGIGYTMTNYSPAVCGDELYVGPLCQYINGNWYTSSTNTWGPNSTGGLTYSNIALHYKYIPGSLTWTSRASAVDGDINNGFNSGNQIKIYTPYVKCTTNYQYSTSQGNPTTSGNAGAIYDPVNNANRQTVMNRSGMAPDSIDSTTANNYTFASYYVPAQHSRWCPHPTDPKLVYFSPSNSGWIYLMDTQIYATYGILALTSVTNGCLTRTRYAFTGSTFIATHDGKFYDVINQPTAGQTGSISYIAEIQPIPAELDTGY